MAAKKKGLPEVTVSAPDHANMVALAKKALDFRTQIADLVTKEAETKTALSEAAIIVRGTEEKDKGNYVGLIRITDPTLTPCQVQFKITGGALDLTEGPTLDTLFEASRPLLFEKDVVVTGVIDPDALLTQMKSQGKNPWDFLELKVKSGMDLIVSESVHVTKEEAFLPKKDFLATLNDVKHTFVDKAKDYIRNYLAQVLKPTVDLGKK